VSDFVLKINSDFDDLPAAADAATQFLESNKASPDVIFAANLAIEEIVTNIIKYGYDDALKHEITVRLDVTENMLNIEICDDGKEFNPFNQPEPDISLSPEEPQIGGLGIHFVRKMLDACAYDRRDGRNIVKLSKKL
jgi:anti-sigma regulatory factor (Ser/Thr protein kinase)